MAYNTTMTKTFEERQKECSEEIRLILRKYKFELSCSMILSSGAVTPVIDLVEVKEKSSIVLN